jgi:hypothetical protein
MTETKIEEITINLKEYARIQYAVFRLQFVEKMAAIGSTMLSDVLVSSVALIALLFLSAGGAFYISQMTGSYALGFLVVGGLYILIALILMVFRGSILRTRMRDKFITELLKEGNTK